MRKLIAIALCAAIAAVSAVAVAPPAPAEAAVTIRLSNSGFSRGVTTIRSGELVRFRITARGHGVYSRHVPRGAKRFRSRTKRYTYRVRLRRRGTWHVVCTRHGSRHEAYIRVR